LLTSRSAEPLDRRALLQASLAALAAALSGCAESPTPVAAPALTPLPPLAIPSLDALLPLAGLRYVVLARPREIAAIPWLIPSIAAFASEERLDRFARFTAIDLRQTPEALVAAYTTEEGEATIELARHAGNAQTIERAFRDRISSEAERFVDRPDLIRVTGKIGLSKHAFAALGPDVVCFQQGGSMKRGPCRIATLFATNKLKRTTRLFSDESLRVLDARLGPAPLRAFAPGPFEGDVARAARGLGAAATALGAAVRPSAREALFLSLALTGDFSTTGDVASRELQAAWQDLASGSFGHLLGLDAPVTTPLATYATDAVSLVVELDPRKLSKGLADATTNEIDAIMR